MRKHFTRLLTTLLALVILLPIVAQAAPTDGWTDEAEQAYQTVTQLVIQRVTESKDYLATATQEENTKAVYALWTSGAAVPSGFYDEYLQALADWLDLAVKRGQNGLHPRCYPHGGGYGTGRDRLRRTRPDGRPAEAGAGGGGRGPAGIC